MFEYTMHVAQQLNDASESEQLTSSEGFEFEFTFDFEFQYNDDSDEVQTDILHEIKTCNRSEILSGIGPNILFGLLRDKFPLILSSSGITERFLRIMLIPDILSFAWTAQTAPNNQGLQKLKLWFQSRIEWVNDVVIAQPLNFTPANSSSVRCMKRTRYAVDGDDGQPTMEKDSQKECSICLCEFSEGEEIAWVPCGHAYHDSCIVRWLGTSGYCPLCRYRMPS